MNCNFPIDIVVPWVDGDDAAWLTLKNHYANQYPHCDSSESRYRNWDFLQYLFRGIEYFTPWINKVYFITNGQIPSWLNLNHPKLRFITHEEFIPKEYLPTFNSHTIELNLHRIKDLSEHFIYMNDDMFFIKPLNYTDFFNPEGLPCDSSVQENIINKKEKHGFGIQVIDFCNLGILNAHFRKKHVVKGNFYRWYGLYMGIEKSISAVLKSNLDSFSGFHNYHCPQPFLKSTWNEVWNTEPSFLNSTCKSKFRDNINASQYLMRYWQLASNKFQPTDLTNRIMFNVGDDNIVQAICAIKSNEYKMICLNDCDNSININFEKSTFEIREALQYILPNKSTFEI